MVAENPLFGLGLNTYSLNFARFKPPDYEAQMYTHNSYVQMATESGLLGTGLFILFLAVLVFACAGRLLKRRDTDPSKVLGAALLAGVFGLLVNCLFDSVLQSTQLRTLFWSLLGAALAVAAL
jgi:O-antigen ligase